MCEHMHHECIQTGIITIQAWFLDLPPLLLAHVDVSDVGLNELIEYAEQSAQIKLGQGLVQLVVLGLCQFLQQLRIQSVKRLLCTIRIQIGKVYILCTIE